MTGQITVGSTVINVTSAGLYGSVATQVSGGTNFWDPSAPYTSIAVSNPPPDTDIIGLNVGGRKTITFSQAVVDPVLALVSWNGTIIDFGTPLEILSEGEGYWGTGFFDLNSAGTGFTGVSAVHGTIRLPGTFTTITVTDTGEYLARLHRRGHGARGGRSGSGPDAGARAGHARPSWPQASRPCRGEAGCGGLRQGRTRPGIVTQAEARSPPPARRCPRRGR